MNKRQNVPLILASLAFAILLTGDLLLWFYLDYRRVDPPRLPTAIHRVDAAAVLAGGPGRLRQGYNLLRQEKADVLLIIGSNPHSRSRDILTNILALRNLCRELGFHSLVIVTAAFHLKRAYHLCQRILPPNWKSITCPSRPKTAPAAPSGKFPLPCG